MKILELDERLEKTLVELLNAGLKELGLPYAVPAAMLVQQLEKPPVKEKQEIDDV